MTEKIKHMYEHMYNLVSKDPINSQQGPTKMLLSFRWRHAL